MNLIDDDVLWSLSSSPGNHINYTIINVFILGVINRQFSSTDTENSSPKFRKRAQTQLKPIGGGRDNNNNNNNNAVVEKAAQLGLFSWKKQICCIENSSCL